MVLCVVLGSLLALLIGLRSLFALSRHYFETALNPSFCVRGSEDPHNQGFYLVIAMGSEQAGLTALNGSVVREAAVSRSVSGLRNALTTIRSTLETN